MNLLPKTFKMFDTSMEIKKELNLNNYHLGNKYCQLFAEVLKVDHLNDLE